MKSGKLLLSIVFMMAFVFMYAPKIMALSVNSGSGTIVNIGSGTTAKVSGGTLTNASGSTIQGTGTLDVSGATFSNAGNLNPGNSVGTLSITGNFPQTSTGALNIELGGTSAGPGYDRLSVSGSSTLAGSLNVSLINSFIPSLGNTFQIVNYTSSSGSFYTLNLPALSGGLEWDTDIGTSSITLTVNQSGGGCIYTILPTSNTSDSSGGAGSVSVTTSSGCDWTANSNDTWIEIDSGSSGSGNGTVNYSVSENTSMSSRTGTITIIGDNYTETFTVTQAGVGACTYSLSSTSASFDSNSHAGSVNVATTNACSWTATSNDTWITVTSGSSGSGNGTVSYSVSANTSTSTRTGTMTIAERTFTVTQVAPESLSPDIKANNSDGPITIGTDGNLSIEISLSAADHVGEESDWWLVASTPSGLESYDLVQDGFVPGLAVTYQGVIFDLDSITIFDTSGLDAGTYIYYFGIDLDMNGDLDMDEGLLYHDSVVVMVEEGADGGGLSSPTGFTASSDGTTVTLSWDAVDEAEGYRLYYGYSSGEYSGTSDLGNSASMVFENVPEGTYYLAITAYTDTEESGYSEEVSVTVQ